MGEIVQTLSPLITLSGHQSRSRDYEIHLLQKIKDISSKNKGRGRKKHMCSRIQIQNLSHPNPASQDQCPTTTPHTFFVQDRFSVHGDRDWEDCTITLINLCINYKTSSQNDHNFKLAPTFPILLLQQDVLFFWGGGICLTWHVKAWLLNAKLIDA